MGLFRVLQARITRPSITDAMLSEAMEGGAMRRRIVNRTFAIRGYFCRKLLQIKATFSKVCSHYALSSLPDAVILGGA